MDEPRLLQTVDASVSEEKKSEHDEEVEKNTLGSYTGDVRDPNIGDISYQEFISRVVRSTFPDPIPDTNGVAKKKFGLRASLQHIKTKFDDKQWTWFLLFLESSIYRASVEFLDEVCKRRVLPDYNENESVLVDYISEALMNGISISMSRVDYRNSMLCFALNTAAHIAPVTVFYTGIWEMWLTQLSTAYKEYWLNTQPYFVMWTRVYIRAYLREKKRKKFPPFEGGDCKSPVSTVLQGLKKEQMFRSVREAFVFQGLMRDDAYEISDDATTISLKLKQTGMIMYEVLGHKIKKNSEYDKHIKKNSLYDLSNYNTFTSKVERVAISLSKVIHGRDIALNAFDVFVMSANGDEYLITNAAVGDSRKNFDKDLQKVNDMKESRPKKASPMKRLLNQVKTRNASKALAPKALAPKALAPNSWYESWPPLSNQEATRT